jgi:hypothetical protein
MVETESAFTEQGLVALVLEPQDCRRRGPIASVALTLLAQLRKSHPSDGNISLQNQRSFEVSAGE